jgi:microsomal epoxide hydrolase
MIDKFLSWSDVDGDTLSAWTPERLLTPVMIYWVTQCIGPSLALYATSDRPLRASDRIEVPTVVTIPREQRPGPPESWLRRVYADLRLVRSRPRGGHFMAVEDPAGFVDEVRSAFGSPQA